MTNAELLVDAFSRIREEVKSTIQGLSTRQLCYRADPPANTIAWLVWHLTRIQDDHLAAAFATEQIWISGGWVDRFALPFEPTAHGYGHTTEEVGAVRVDADLLTGYHEATHARTVELLAGVTEGGLDRVVDDRWDPPVTLGVRLVSVISDDLQHVGQAAFIRGLLERSDS